MDDLAGRTFLVTGANTGIGLVTAGDLAGRGGRVYLACRSEEKGQAAVASIKAATGHDAVFFLPLDLGDLSSVRACAKAFLALDEPLHVLINNAGVGGARGTTKDGFETTFGVNHLGPFAFTSALLGRLADSAPARIVNVSSKAHYQAPGIDFGSVRRPTATRTGLREYVVSKLCNVLYTQELARRIDSGVTAYALHPGVVASDIWRRVPWPLRKLMTLPMISPERGARTSLYCATSPELAGVTGRYYDECKERAPSPAATPELAAELWDRSTAWTTQAESPRL